MSFEIRKVALSEPSTLSAPTSPQLHPLTSIVTQILKLDTSHFPSNSIQYQVIAWASDQRNSFSQNPKEALLDLEKKCLNSQTTLHSLLQNGNFFKSLFKIEEVKEALLPFLNEFPDDDDLYTLNIMRMRLIELAKEAKNISDLKNKYLDEHDIDELIPFGEDSESVVSFSDEPKIVQSAYKDLLIEWHSSTLLKINEQPHLFDVPCSYQELANYLVEQSYPSHAEFAFYYLEQLCENGNTTLMNLMLSENIMKILIKNLPWLETALLNLMSNFHGNIRTNLARMIFFHWCEFWIRINQQCKTLLDERVVPYWIYEKIALQFPSHWKYILPPRSSEPDELIEINDQHKEIYALFERAYQKKKRCSK